MSASDQQGEAGGQITQLLASVREGDRNAIDLVFSLVYAELHTAARRQLARARPGQTVDTTMLVHEAYLKLVDSAHAHFADRGHFFAVAAKAMRQIIIDHARWASRKKRGGGAHKISLDGIDVADEERASELVALDAALDAPRVLQRTPRAHRRTAVLRGALGRRNRRSTGRSAPPDQA